MLNGIFIYTLEGNIIEFKCWAKYSQVLELKTILGFNGEIVYNRVIEI